SANGSPYDIIVSNASGGTFNLNNYNIKYVDGSLMISGVTPMYYPYIDAMANIYLRVVECPPVPKKTTEVHWDASNAFTLPGQMEYPSEYNSRLNIPYTFSTSAQSSTGQKSKD